MRLGRFPHARLILWLGVLIISCLIPVQAQLQGQPQTPLLPLTQNWQYHWDTIQPTPQPSADPQVWRAIAPPQRLTVPAGAEILWLSIPLPEQRSPFPALYFQGIPHILEASINGAVVYIFDELTPKKTLKHKEGEFPIIALQPEHHGETLLIRSYVADQSLISLGYDGQLLYGENPQLFRQLILQDSIRLSLGFFFITCGFFPLVISLFRQTDSIYGSFSFVAYLIGIYTISTTQIIRLLFDYSILWTFIHHGVFHLLPVSLGFFFEHVFGMGPKKLIRRLWQIHLFYAPLALILAGTEIITWKTAAFPTQMGALFTASVIIISAVWKASKGNREAKALCLGLALFLSCTMYDILNHLYHLFPWPFQLYPWGMLFFLICLAFILERRFIEAQNHLKAYAHASDRFVPHEFLQFLGKTSIIDVQLGDQVEQEMTVLFSDIRSFTSISESMPPERNFNFLNAYLKKVSPAIREHGGFIDKYIGDAVMALFPQRVEDAVGAAIAMQTALYTFNQEIRAEGYPAINIGIGLHRGKLMLGTIGEAERMETTVIADAVNLASRLEESTKRFGANLIISQKTLRQMANPDQFAWRYLGKIMVKGKKESVEICEIYESDPPPLKAFKKATRSQFEQGIHLYDQGEIEAAANIFKTLWERNPEDTVTHLCLLRCKHL